MVSLTLFFLLTCLMLTNVTRTNITLGIDDEVISGFIFIIGTMSVMGMAYIPMQVLLTYLVPNNAEASTMALISGIFIWSYEVGAKITTNILCRIFNVDDDHMDNYPHLLIAKLPLIMIVMCFSYIVPSNEDIQDKAQFLREEHRRSLMSQTERENLEIISPML